MITLCLNIFEAVISKWRRNLLSEWGKESYKAKATQLAAKSDINVKVKIFDGVNIWILVDQ